MSDFEEQAWQGFFSNEPGEEQLFDDQQVSPEAWDFDGAEGTDLRHLPEATEQSESSVLPTLDGILQLDEIQTQSPPNDIFQTLMEETSLVPLVQGMEAE